MMPRNGQPLVYLEGHLSFGRFGIFKASDFSDNLKVPNSFKVLSTTSFQLPRSLQEATQFLVVLLVKEAISGFRV